MSDIEDGATHFPKARLIALLRSGKVHGRRQSDGSWHYLPAHHGFCTVCGAAFGTDRAFDAHRSLPSGGHCEELALPMFVMKPNKYGTPVWRLALDRATT